MKNIRKLENRLKNIITKFDGTAGIAMKNLKYGDEIYLNADDRFPTASTIKISIMVEVFYQKKENKIRLSDILKYNRRKHVQGSGIIQYLSDGLEISIYDAIVLMIVISDNTTSNMLIDILGVKNINNRMESLGLPNIKLFRKAFAKTPVVEPALCKKFGFGMATPREMNLLLEKIYYGQLVDKNSCRMMLDIMKKQFYEAQLRRWISGNNIWIANKTGSVTGVRNDVGIIHTNKSDWIISVYCKNIADKSTRLDNAGQIFIATVSKEIFDFYTA